MPRKKLPPRLSLRKDNRTWVIRDGDTYLRTGCSEGEIAEAEEKLCDYIAAKWQPATSTSRQSDTYLADVIVLYSEHKVPTFENPKRADEFLSTMGRLTDYWGARPVAQILGETCREYARKSTTQSMARKDLEMLRAAVNFYRREYNLDAVPVFTLPPKPEPRDRWLTRSEAARLLWAAHRAGNEHLVRFILLGLYTGSRSGVLLTLQWHPNTTAGWVDLEAGIIYRAAPRARRSRKRKPPVVIANRLRPWLRRWAAKDAGLRYVVHWKGNRIERIHKSFTAAANAAGLGKDNDVIPHCLRHTCATWLMQNGADKWKACNSLGMSMEMLERVYGHHHPDYQNDMRKIF
ncbi:MAG: site-specific integrase [Rhizobiaceae bacterium]|nr:site-specific integrase [Rhizobiaceae bacterium]